MRWYALNGCIAPLYMMLTPERKRMMMVVTCLRSFLLAISTEKVMMFVRKPRMDRATHSHPAVSWLSELIIELAELRKTVRRRRECLCLGLDTANTLALNTLNLK